MVRMFWDPTECCVQPRANRLVSALSGAAVLANRSQAWRNFVLRRAADARHRLERVPVNVLTKHVHHAAWILPCIIDLGVTLIVEFVVPTRFVVAVRVLLVAGEQAVLEAEALLYDQTGVCIGPHIVVLDPVFLQEIADHAVQERDIGPRADRHIEVGDRRGAREARIDHDQLGLVLDLRFNRPFEAARMRFGGIASHHQNDVCVLDVLPGVGHCAATECWGQTGHRRCVSNAGLVVEDQNSERAGQLPRNV